MIKSRSVLWSIIPVSSELANWLSLSRRVRHRWARQVAHVEPWYLIAITEPSAISRGVEFLIRIHRLLNVKIISLRLTVRSKVVDFMILRYLARIEMPH